jgi:ribosomal protein S18 acetylase RimI-like enzyme
VALWEACELTRPWNDPRADIARKTRNSPEWFLVAEIDAHLVGTVMVGYDGHRGWINYLATEPSHRRHGIGRALIAEVERLLASAGCPKINLQVRSENAAAIDFYRRLGYVEDPVVSMGKRLVDDRR